MDLPDLVFDAERKNVLAVIVGSFTAVMPQRTGCGPHAQELRLIKPRVQSI